MFRTLQIVGFALAGLLYAIGGLIAFGLFIWMLSPGGWFLIPVALIIGAAVVSRLRRRRVAAILQHLTACFRLNLPLAPTLESAAHSETGQLSRRLGDLSQYLGHGETLSQALSQSVPELPRRDRAVIVAAEPVNRLPQAFERLLLCHRTAEQGETSMAGMVLAYATLMLVATGAMFTFVLIVIIPKFEKIFDDFGTRLAVAHSRSHCRQRLAYRAVNFRPGQQEPDHSWRGVDRAGDPGFVWRVPADEHSSRPPIGRHLTCCAGMFRRCAVWSAIAA